MSKMTPRLQTRFNNEVTTALREEFKYTNVNETPKITKVVLNMGLGAVVQNPKIIEFARDELSMIAG